MGADYEHAPVEWVTQTPAILDQAAPVNGTFYTVLAATGVYTRIFDIIAYVQTVGETLELEITIDGRLPIITPWAAAAGTVYEMIVSNSIAAEFTFAGWHQYIPYINQYGHDVLIRLRKNTAAGAGNLRAKVHYALSP